MAGLWNLSMMQRIDLNGRPYPGAKAYFFRAGTTTPLLTYQNNDLSVLHPHPVIADGYGVFPAVFLDEADEYYGVRLTTAGGTILPPDIPTLPIIGPSGGGGGGGGGTPVDPNALWQTGDIKARFATGVHPGWERCNGRTIGDSTSGATGRANADTQPLFEFLWAAVPNTILAVNGGRGASAAADYAAHKTIQLPDFRGRAVFGLDDMGTTAAGRILAALVDTGSPTQLGSSGGEDQHTLITNELPVITPAGTISGGAHTHLLASNDGPLRPRRSERQAADVSSVGAGSGSDGSISSVSTNTGDGTHTHPFAGTPFGGGAAHNNMPPFGLTSVYIKL